MSLRTAMQRFRTQVADQRASVWPATIQVGTATPIACAKSPTKNERVSQEQGAGWVQRALATYSFSAAGDYTPTLGAEWTLTVAVDPAEVGTRWRVFKITGPSAAADHLVQCFRLD